MKIDVVLFSEEQQPILDRLRRIPRALASSQISHNFEFTIIDRVVAPIASDHLFR
jgi:hypothetical protein